VLSIHVFETRFCLATASWSSLQSTARLGKSDTTLDGSAPAHFADARYPESEPDQGPVTASVDISWIAYKDQAEQLGLLTRMALVDIELERLSRRSDRKVTMQAA